MLVSLYYLFYGPNYKYLTTAPVAPAAIAGAAAPAVATIATALATATTISFYLYG